MGTRYGGGNVVSLVGSFQPTKCLTYNLRSHGDDLLVSKATCSLPRIPSSRGLPVLASSAAIRERGLPLVSTSESFRHQKAA